MAQRSVKLGCQCSVFLTLTKKIVSPGCISSCSQKCGCLVISQESCNGSVLKIINNLDNERKIILSLMQSKSGCLIVGKKAIHTHFSSTINETFQWGCLFNNIILMYTVHAALS